MSELISFVLGLALGAAAGFLVYRNNKARFADTEKELRDAHVVIDSLRKRLSDAIKGQAHVLIDPSDPYDENPYDWPYWPVK